MSTSQTYSTDQAGGAQGTEAATAAKDTAKEQASQVGQSAGQAASQVADTTKEQAREVVSEATAQVRDLATELRLHLDTQAGTQRDRAVGTLRSLSDELERMGRGEGGADGVAGEIVRQAAERARTVAGYLDEREPGDLVADLRSFASRRPTAFLVGAAVAGLVAGRLTRGARDARSTTGSSTELATASPAPVGPYGGTGAPPLGTSVSGYSAVGPRDPATGPLARNDDDVLDLDAPVGLGRPPRNDLPGGGAL